MVAALYIALMYVGQGFAFGVYQVRLATAIYALAYLFPFSTVPLALANALSNALLGGFGVFDIVGGFGVGLVTAGAIALVRICKLPAWLVILPNILGPGLIVPLWLSHITGVPYWALVVNISIGQITPAILGYILIRALSKRKVADQ